MKARRPHMFHVLSACLGLLVMPYFGVAPEAGLDSSWAAGLHMAHNQGLLFGSDIVFTFGPLGWLIGATVNTPVTGVVAMLMRVPLVMGSCLVACSMWRRLVPSFVALLLGVLTTWVAVSTLATGGELPALVPIVLAGWFLCRLLELGSCDQPSFRWTPAMVSLICAFTTLTKFDSGVTALLVGCAGYGAVWSIERNNGNLRFGLAMVGVSRLLGLYVAWLMLGWVALGQRLGSLWNWIFLSADLTLGFQTAMVATGRPRSDLLLAALLFVALLIGTLAAQRSVPPTKQSNLGQLPGGIGSARLRWAVLYFVGSAAMVAKQAFTRHDVGHVLRLFSAATVLGLCIAVSQSKAPRKNRRIVSWLAISILVISSCFAWTIDPAVRRSLFERSGKDDQYRRMISTTKSSAVRRDLIKGKRQLILETLELTPSIAAAARGKRLHVEGWEAAGGWALATTQGGVWAPLPIFQSYSAYTAKLDEVNRARLADAKLGPEVVFVETRTIDGRWSRWESPATMLQLLCSFRPGPSTERWQVMERRPDGDGCGDPRELGAPSVAVLGGPLVTPEAPADGFVTIRFEHLPVRKVRALVTRSSTWWVLRPYEAGVRLLEGHAAQPHILSVPACLRGALGPIDTSSTPLLSVSSVNAEPEPTESTVTARYEFLPYRCP